MNKQDLIIRVFLTGGTIFFFFFFPLSVFQDILFLN